MKVKILVGALVVLVLVNIAALGSFWYMQSHAPRPYSGWRQDRGPGDGPWIGRNMSKEERRKLFRTMRSFREETQPLAEQTNRLEQDLIASMRQDPAPRAHIDSLLQQISDNRLEIARRATDRMLAMGDSLSPEDRGQMIDALMRFRHGNRPGGRDGRRFRDRRND